MNVRDRMEEIRARYEEIRREQMVAEAHAQQAFAREPSDIDESAGMADEASDEEQES